MGEISDLVDVALKEVPKKGDRRNVAFGFVLGSLLTLVIVAFFGFQILNSFTPKGQSPSPVTVIIYPPQNNSVQNPETKQQEKAENNPSPPAENTSPGNTEKSQPPQAEIRSSQRVGINPRQNGESGQSRRATNNPTRESEKTRRDAVPAKPEEFSARCPGSSMLRICAPEYETPYEPPKWLPNSQPAFKDAPWLSNPKFELRPNGLTLHF